MLFSWTTSIIGVIGAETVIGACLLIPRDATVVDSATDACGLRVKVTLFSRLTAYAAIIKSELTPLKHNLKSCIDLAILEDQGAGYDGGQNHLSFKHADLTS